MSAQVRFPRLRVVVVRCAWLLLAGAAWPSEGAASSRTGDREIWRCDFENVALQSVAGLAFGKMKVALVPRPDGKGTCLRLETPGPATFCGMRLTRPVLIERNLVLAFDHREEIEEGHEGAYLGMSFHVGGTQAAWKSDSFGPKWRHVEVQLAQLKLRRGFEGQMKAGLTFDRIELYGRSKDRKKRGDNPCRIKVFFDNIRLYTGAAQVTPVAGKAYTCHNNPPLFDWSGTTRPGTKLQFSMDPEFRDETARTVTLTSPLPLYVPEKPLRPGTWYFRRQVLTELLDGWSNTQKLTIPEGTHSYRLPELDFAPLADVPRPRLLRRIRPSGKPLTESERTRWIRRATAEAERGVQEHPGPYRKGDPRWPNWIDWYGKVAGKVTARTGGRLRRAGEAAMLTGDPEAVAAAKSLLLAACTWDPKGGSSARRGDLQAASLLKGMVWCYDACEGTLNAEERETVHAIIKERLLQFYNRINPFRLNPAQNHPWKKNTIVAETSLVMMGVYPEAAEWLTVAVHNFSYRILPSMGFDGENQEGISYWNYGVNMLANFGDLLLFMAELDLYDHPWLKRTCRFPIYCAPPNAYAISFADNSPRGNATHVGPCGTRLVRLLGTRARDPYALWYANAPDPVVAPRPPVDLPQSVFYPHIGYVVFHTCLSEGREDVGVGMRCGPYHAGHQHDDNNGFVIHAYGDKLAIDGGYYDWYGSPHFKAYSIKTLAHNTLLVDDRCQKRRASGRIAAYFDSPGFGYAVGDASAAEIYQGLLKRFDRRLIFLKPGFLVVHDLVETDGEPRKLSWLLHSHTDEPFPADPAERTFEIRRPRASLRGRFFAPARLDMSVTKSFDVPPQKPRESVFLPWDDVQPEWTMTATPVEKRGREQFFAAMEIRPAGEADTPGASEMRGFETATALGCELRAAYGTYLVLSRKLGAEGPLSAEGLESDGEAAAVLLARDGRPVDAMAVGATFVRFRGTRIFGEGPGRRRRAPANWAMRADAAPQRIHARLVVDRRAQRMEGRLFPSADGDRGVWWANIDSAERCRSELVVHGWTGNRPPQVRLNGRTHTGCTHTVALAEGLRCLTVTGQGRFDRVALSRFEYRILEAEALPRETKTRPGDVVIDTDDPGPFAQSPRRGRVMKKVAATGGRAFCGIDGPVQWAEWRFSAPADGDYQLLVRGASEHDAIEREVRIDGKPFPGADVAVRMRGTGGWCRSSDNWGWSRVRAANGTPATVHLARGEHTLRWEFVKGSQNIDVLVLRPVRGGD